MIKRFFLPDPHRERTARWHRPARRLAQALLLLVLPAGPVTADVQHPNLERGFNPDKAYQAGDIDQINLFNGNLSVTIPIGNSFEGNGDLSYALTLVYNSNVWDWSYVKKINDPNRYPGALASADSNAGLGWRLSLGELLPPLAGRNEAQLVAYRNETNQWLYIDPSGADHLFYESLESGQPATPGVIGYTRDGSYLRLVERNGQKQVHFPDGMVHRFNANGLPSAIDDAWGNRLNISYLADRWVLNDGFRQHTVVFVNRFHDERQVPMVSYIDVAKFGGGSARYQLVYQGMDVERPVGHDPRTRNRQCPWDTARHCARVPMLTRIALPDGSDYLIGSAGYHFRRENVTLPYDENGDGINDTFRITSPGVLREMRLPTLGFMRWTYRGYKFPNGWEIDPDVQNPDPQFWQAGQGIGRREILNYNRGSFNGDWWYQPKYRFNFETLPDGTVREEPLEITNRVRDPHGNVQTHYFNAKLKTWTYGLPFSDFQPSINDHWPGFGNVRIYRSLLNDPNGGDTRATYVAYETTGCSIDWKKGRYDCNRRPRAGRTNYGGGKFMRNLETQFDGLGHYRRSIVRSNFRGGSEQVRVEHVAYTGQRPGGFAPWILDTYPMAWQRENYLNGSAGTWTEFRQQLCFNPQTGALDRERLQQTAGTNGRDDVIRVNLYNRLGNVTHERAYGGDTQTVGVGHLCNMGLPGTPVYGLQHSYQYGQRSATLAEGTTYRPFRGVVDANTGLLSQVQDSASFRTDYTFDSLGRVSLIRPQQGAETAFVYNRATGAQLDRLAKARVLRRNRGTTTILTQEEYRYDAMGRVREQRRQIPGGWMKRQTFYANALGWKLRESTWGPDNQSPAGWTRFKNYDGYGRPGVIEAPDIASNNQHKTTLTYAGAHAVSTRVSVGTHLQSSGSVGENQYTTTTRYDALGRIWEVQEPGNALNARYSYDAGGSLREARLDGGSGTIQYRRFGYDGRGFMTFESHPENGRFDYMDIDAGGVARRKRHASGSRDLVFEYDKAKRLTAVRDRLLPSLPYLKRFEFATSNTSSNWREGKLWKATRYNVRQVPWNPSAIVRFPVEEEYTYGGIGGRVSRRITRLNSGQRVFDQSWSYDQLGNVKTLGYPRCATAGCAGQSGPQRTLTYDYAAGLMTGVRNVATLTYHVNGKMASVRHANGVTDSLDKDPWNRPLPRNIRVTLANGGSTDLGTHLYDGAGNLIERRQAPVACPPGISCLNYYLYDPASRLRHFHERAGGFEAYNYDNFGNLNRVTWTDSGLNPQVRNIPISPSNNRLTMGVTYDPLGNMTSRNLGLGTERHAYDELEMLASRNFPDETYLYTADDERIWTLSYDENGPNDEVFTLRDLDGRVLRTYDMQVTGAVENWTWRKDHVYRDGGMVASYTNDTFPQNRVHYTLDHLGTPRLVTDIQGNSIRSHHYFGFGREFGFSAEHPDLEQRFTGHERDLNGPGQNDNLDYMHARYFSPFLYRFQSVDPAIESAKLPSPQSWNRYAYANNNPLRYVDPDGENPLLAAAAIGGGVDAGITILGNLANGRDAFDGAGKAFVRGAVVGAAGFGVFKLAGRGVAAIRAARLQRGIAAGRVIPGPLGTATRESLELAAQSGGPSVKVVTNLDSAPDVGRALSVAAGDGAEALAATARKGTIFEAKIPKALLRKLEDMGLATRSTTEMGGKIAHEIRFRKEASEFIARFFAPR